MCMHMHMPCMFMHMHMPCMFMHMHMHMHMHSCACTCHMHMHMRMCTSGLSFWPSCPCMYIALAPLLALILTVTPTLALPTHHQGGAAQRVGVRHARRHAANPLGLIGHPRRAGQGQSGVRRSSENVTSSDPRLGMTTWRARGHTEPRRQV